MSIHRSSSLSGRSILVQHDRFIAYNKHCNINISFFNVGLTPASAYYTAVNDAHTAILIFPKQIVEELCMVYQNSDVRALIISFVAMLMLFQMMLNIHLFRDFDRNRIQVIHVHHIHVQEQLCTYTIEVPTYISS